MVPDGGGSLKRFGRSYYWQIAKLYRHPLLRLLYKHVYLRRLQLHFCCGMFCIKFLFFFKSAYLSRNKNCSGVY